MLSRIRSFYSNRKAIKELEEHPIYSAVLAVLRDTFNRKTCPYGKDTKQKITRQLVEKTKEIIESNNLILKNREFLVSEALCLADVKVLILDASKEDPDNFIGQVGITGELKENIKLLYKENDLVREGVFACGYEDPTAEQLMEVAQFVYYKLYLNVGIFNAIRIVLKDVHDDPQKDWVRPMLNSMCAVAEARYREKIGLPDVLSTQDEAKEAAIIKHGSFMFMVLNGSRYPYMEFRERFRRK